MRGSFVGVHLFRFAMDLTAYDFLDDDPVLIEAETYEDAVRQLTEQTGITAEDLEQGFLIDEEDEELGGWID